MIYLRSCPRCREGALEETYDIWGKYARCLTCGYYRDIHRLGHLQLSAMMEMRPTPFRLDYRGSIVFQL